MWRERRKHLFELVDEYVRRAEFYAERAFASGWNEVAACIEPLYNIFVGANEVILTVDLPYVDAEDVALKVVSEDTIEVLANTNRKITFDDLGVKHREGEFTRYHTRIHIPVAVNESGMAYKFKRGVLEVHLPRIV